MIEAAFWRLTRGKPADDSHVEWAYDIYREVTEREILQAFILAKATDAEVYETLRVPVPVTQVYRHLFFDADAFRDELQILSWIRLYEENNEGTAHGTQLLKMALMLGVKGLRWLYGRDSSYAEPAEIQRQVMTDAYFRGQAHRMYAINSPEAKAAMNMLNTALKVASQLSKKTDNTGIKALAIRLRHREMTTSIEEVRPDDAPLH
jgi:hypothetical protein